jgi:hypothetical protein
VIPAAIAAEALASRTTIIDPQAISFIKPFIITSWIVQCMSLRWGGESPPG